MPAIHLLGRRTLLGGDELQPIVFLAICLRSAQLLFFAIPILVFVFNPQQSDGSNNVADFITWRTTTTTTTLETSNLRWLEQQQDKGDSSSSSCQESHYFLLLLTIYVIASCVYALASSIVEWRISKASSLGTPTYDLHIRTKRIVFWLELKLLPATSILLCICLAGLCAVAFAPMYYQCSGSRNVDGGHKATSFQLWWLALAFLLFSQLAEVLVSLSFVVHLCQQPREETLQAQSLLQAPEDNVSEQQQLQQNHELVEEMWADRCAAFCRCLSLSSCFVFGGHELLVLNNASASFGDVARALADYLETRNVLDVVPSDIVAGFVVLQQLQRQRIREARRDTLQQQQRAELLPSPSSNESVDQDTITMDREDCAPNTSTSSYNNSGNSGVGISVAAPSPIARTTTPPRAVFRFDSNYNVQRLSRSLLSRHQQQDLAVLQEGARYSRYSLAIYTWVLYVYVHPATGLLRLLGHAGCESALCTFCRRRRQRSVETYEGDNMCQMHKTALLLTADLEQADLVYAQLKSGFSENPYCILLDHKYQSVVVSIRGTFSLEDCVTDVLIDPESLEPLGDEFGFAADAANQYCHGGVLACVWNVYRDLQSHGHLNRLLLGDNALYPDYTLKLVGHSLGAATCTILSYMLRPTFPTVRCFNYSPPGCSLTWEMATKCKAWCTSFVLDSDLVPRLSRDSMEHLRDEILDLIGRIKVPKIEVVQRAVHGDGRIEDILHDTDDVPETDYREQLERFKAIQNERREARGTVRSIKLYPPGQLVHLVKTGERKSCLHGLAKCMTCFTSNAGFDYTPVWIDNDDLKEIVVTPTMGTDHFPNRIRFMLERVAEDYGVDPS